MSKKVVITGVEVLCANANDYEQLIDVLKNNASGIVECSLFDTSKLIGKKVGQVQMEFSEFSNESGKERLDHMVERVVQSLLDKTALTPSYLNRIGNRAMISFATSLAGNEKLMKASEGDHTYPYLSNIPYFISHIKKQTGILGESFVTMTACASGTASAGIAFDYIHSGDADICLVGGADSLREFSCYGFHSLKSLSESECKPFDDIRDGINIGEAAVFFVFEEYEHAKARGANIIAEVVGYGIGNDAYHMTTPDITGYSASRTMLKALKDVDDVQYINAHGTSTKINDEMELKAITQVLDEKQINSTVHVSSTKSLFGHCLGAAGSIELAIVCGLLEHKFLPASRAFHSKLETDSRIDLLEGESQTFDGEYILSNSFAFGGNTASILLRSVES